MLWYILRRLLLMIPTLFGITLLVLFFITLTPGDPIQLMTAGREISEQEKEEMRTELGLNDPFFVRYVKYIGNIILKGDFGRSLRTRRPVLTEILQRFPYSLTLTVISMLFAVCIGIPVGIYAATHQYTWKDNASIFGALFCVSMPNFWFALLLIQLLAVKLRILPAAGVDTWQGWILPAFSGSLGFTATVARQTRSNLLEVIRQDFITTARAKGQTERKVLYRHALKNALIPVIMVIGSVFGLAMGGSMVLEVVYSITGLGNYTLSALQFRDYPVIQTSVLFMSAVYAVLLLIIDVLFALIDPRIRAQYARKKKKA